MKNIFCILAVLVVLTTILSIPGLAFASRFVPSENTNVKLYFPVIKFSDVNEIPPEYMVLVPAGPFSMGCDPAYNGGFECLSIELPLHSVYLDAYFIDQYEVTNAEYALCVDAEMCLPPYSDFTSTRVPYFSNPDYANYPVVWVTWKMASTYCAWINSRLPTEAEWEKAARGPVLRTYPWGEQDPSCALTNFTGLTPCIGDTNSIGSYTAGASPYGVYDMAGNVWEWVNDWYAGDYYQVSPGNNPQGPTEGTVRVIRGNAFSAYISNSRTALRNDFQPLSPDPEIGFRCARTP